MSVAAVATDENRIVAAAAADENWRPDNQVVICSTGHQDGMTTNRTGTPVGKVSMNTGEGAGVGIGHHPTLDPFLTVMITGREKDQGLHPQQEASTISLMLG